jgi:hypothetical protein
MSELKLQPAFPQLDITSGLHHGVHMALEESEYLIGLNAESDIVLRDDGVMPRHARLRIEGREARIEAIGGDVVVDGMTVATGHGCRAKLPATIAIGSANLRLSPPSGAPNGVGTVMGRIAENPTWLAGGVIACALAVVVASNGIQQSASVAPVADTAKVDQSFSEERTAAQYDDAPAPTASAQAASEELAAKLKEAGLGTLRATITDGRVLVEGRLTEQQASAWSSVQRWFDGRYSQNTVLVSNVAIGPLAGPAPVRLQAVWFGQRPYIIADNGSHYYEGAVLESGWTVQRIGEDRVVLSRDQETLALTYQ